MIDITKPVRTKGSKTPVEILRVSDKRKHAIIGLMTDDDTPLTWTLNGAFHVRIDKESILDLENYEVEA